MLHFYQNRNCVPRVYLSFLIFEYFPLINEASYLFCDSRSYIFQHLNNSHFTWPVRGNAIWSNFKQAIVENFSSVPSFRRVSLTDVFFSRIIAPTLVAAFLK